MAVLAHIEALEESRRSRRWRLSLSTSAAVGREHQEVAVHDLSSTGLLIETRARLRIGDEIAVDLPELEAADARVIWNSGNFYGCQFLEPIGAGVVSASLLKSSFAEAPRPEVVTSDVPHKEDAGQPQSNWNAKVRVLIGLSAALWGIMIVGLLAI